MLLVLFRDISWIVFFNPITGFPKTLKGVRDYNRTIDDFHRQLVHTKNPFF